MSLAKLWLGVFRFRMRRLPELSRFEDETVLRAALSQAMKDIRSVYCRILAWVFLAALPILLLVAFVTRAWTVSTGAFRVTFWVVIFSTFVLSDWLVKPHVAKSLRRQLLERGVPICLECGRDLADVSGVCPDCGEAVLDEAGVK